MTEGEKFTPTTTANIVSNITCRQANITAKGNITAKQYNKKSHSNEWLFLYSVAYFVSEIEVSV